MSALPAFALPERLEAREPPEARGLARDEVRLLVAQRAAGRLAHARVRYLPGVLQPGDLLVVNTSATLPAALDARRADGESLVLHLSTRLPEGWLVELRRGGARFGGGRAGGGRVIAVGTTVVRALESAAAADGTVAAADGLTRLMVTPQRGVRAVDGLVTGWHDPDASHLLLLQAVAGPALVGRSYREALAGGYLWHEFGDAHLLLP